MKAGESLRSLEFLQTSTTMKNSKPTHYFKSVWVNGSYFVAIGSFDGVPFPLARIDVGHVVGKEPWEHTIWVEMQYLQPQAP